LKERKKKFQSFRKRKKNLISWAFVVEEEVVVVAAGDVDAVDVEVSEDVVEVTTKVHRQPLLN